MAEVQGRMRVLWWGTYDPDNPRVKILQQGLQCNGVEIVRCHRAIWGPQTKTQMTRFLKVWKILRCLCSYPRLVFCFFTAPKSETVVVSHLGLLDLFVLWPFSRVRGVTIVWDAFISLYDTVVFDRKLASKGGIVAGLLWGLEYLACRMADCIVLDTRAHADYFAQTFRLPPEKIKVIHVGAEPTVFPPATAEKFNDPEEFIVLFYGTFIPLHGIDTILDAARLAKGLPWKWVIIGKGQKDGRLRADLAAHQRENIEWIPWVDYSELSLWINRANVCLGIFGDTGKAARVIPNKVFQILSKGKPLITRDSPAVRELLSEDEGVVLIPPADAKALVEAVKKRQSLWKEFHLYHDVVRERILPEYLGKQFLNLLQTRES
ncbi:glycosyltransferase [Desulforhopalus vacuolatus]|uniref:glycosyltransferase n=1 Tax=Desulforhopalus vacuolatus TaxID=40414 RepID=UPI0019644FB3|nr:glycosyltransferase [Desulforhopalus vacuolatus]